MESEHSLFEITVNDFALWDVLRYSLYFWVLNYRVKTSSVSTHKKKLIDYIGITIKILSVEFGLRNREYLLFSSSRNRDIYNKVIDIASYNVQELLENKFVKLESFNKFDNHYIGYHKEFISKIISKKGISITPYLDAINRFADILQSSFQINRNDILDKLNIDILNFEIDRRYYRYILNRVNPKRIFLTQNGIQKALMLCAFERKIPIIEFQHGIINKNHPAYSYPVNCNYENVKTLPTVLFMFSNFWKDVAYMPKVSKVITGNDYFNNPLKHLHSNGSYDKMDYILIVSSIVHQEEIDNFIMALRKRHINSHIVLKLHPNQIHQYKDICVKYEDDNSTDIILSEFSITDLLSRALCVVLIESTAAYEALQMSKTVYILKRMNYTGHSNIFNEDNVKIIDKYEDIDIVCQNCDTNKKIYFDTFQRDIVQYHINDKDELC